MKKQKISIFITLLFFLVFSSLKSQTDNLPDQPPPPHLVNDFAGILSADDAAALETKLAAFNKETSNQIAIVIVNDLGNYEIADYSFKLGRKWGIGQEKLRNGILIVIKPKTPESRGQAFIATGKGLEGAIPDATSLQIVDKEMIPHFKENNYYEGLNAATDVLMSLAKGEYDFNTYSNKNDFDYSFLFILIPVVIIILISFFRNRNRFNNRGYTMGNGGWFPFVGGGGFGNSDSGSSSSGSDFGGFGGGDFGGGGAGGSW